MQRGDLLQTPAVITSSCKNTLFGWEISGILSVIAENQTAASVLLSPSVRICRSISKDLVHTYFVTAHLDPTKHFSASAMNVNNSIDLIETAAVFKSRCWSGLHGYRVL